MSAVPPWLAWPGAALLLVALGAVLDAPRLRGRVLTVDRRRLARGLVRARERRPPESLYPFFRDLEEAGAALVMGAALSGMLLLLLGSATAGLARLALGIPLYLGLGVVTVALVRLVLLAPRALLLWILRGAVLGTARLLRLPLGERADPDRIPFTFGALLLVWTGAAAWAVVGLARLWELAAGR